MAEQPNGDDMSKIMNTLSVSDDCSRELEVDENMQKKLNKIGTDYESIFSWNIRQSTGNNKDPLTNLVEKCRENCEIIVENHNTFNLDRFYLQLIVVYELYTSKNYEESLSEIENMVKYMELYKFDEVNLMRFSNVFYHVVQATYAYIAVTLNIKTEELTVNIKPINSPVEKAALYALKALIFMEYPPCGNDIALNFANEARKLDESELEWIVIWLHAKGRVRRFSNKFAPDEHEMEAANILSTANNKSCFLLEASNIYKQAGFIHKLNNNQEESKKWYEHSSDLMLKGFEFIDDNIQQLNYCLLTIMDYPKEFQSKIVIDKIIQKLINVKHNRVYQVLGKYYLKCEKDYEKAKMYLSRGMYVGNFCSTIELIKVECLIQPVDKFPFVKTLNMIYDVFLSPKRRLIILSQILMYFYYYENNPSELMRYLKLYMDQDIDDSVKKYNLISAHPLFNVNNRPLVKNKFLYALVDKVENILIHHDWTKDEKEIHDDTFDRFCRMSQIKTSENRFHNDNNKTTCKQQSYGNSSTLRRYPNNKQYNDRKSDCNNWQKQCNENESLKFGKQCYKNSECDWRKQRMNISENDTNSNKNEHQYLNKFSFTKNNNGKNFYG